jgi:T1SS-143 domain-containing protein
MLDNDGTTQSNGSATSSTTPDGAGTERTAQTAQAAPAAPPVPATPAEAVVLTAPAAGETAVTVDPGVVYRVADGVAITGIAQEGGDLVVTFDTGGTIRLVDYLVFTVDEAIPSPALQVPEALMQTGQAATGQPVVTVDAAYLASLGLDLEAGLAAAGTPGAGTPLAPPAPGATGGGGAGFALYQIGQLGEGINPLDLLGDLNFGFAPPPPPEEVGGVEEAGPVAFALVAAPPPQAVNDGVSVEEGVTEIVVGVLDNDINADDVTVTPEDSDINLTVNDNGEIIYTPEPGYTGIKSFDYTISNDSGSSTASVTVNISPATEVDEDGLEATGFVGELVSFQLIGNGTYGDQSTPFDGIGDNAPGDDDTTPDDNEASDHDVLYGADFSADADARFAWGAAGTTSFDGEPVMAYDDTGAFAQVTNLAGEPLVWVVGPDGESIYAVTQAWYEGSLDGGQTLPPTIRATLDQPQGPNDPPYGRGPDVYIKVERDDQDNPEEGLNGPNAGQPHFDVTLLKPLSHPLTAAPEGDGDEDVGSFQINDELEEDEGPEVGGGFEDNLDIHIPYTVTYEDNDPNTPATTATLEGVVKINVDDDMPVVLSQGALYLADNHTDTVYSITFAGGQAHLTPVFNPKVDSSGVNEIDSDTQHIAISNDGATIYVLDEADGDLWTFDLTSGSYALVGRIEGPDGGSLPSSPQVSAGLDGRLYIGSAVTDEIMVVDLSTSPLVYQSLGTIQVGDGVLNIEGADLAFDANGVGYVATRDDGGQIYRITVEPDGGLVGTLIAEDVGWITGMEVMDSGQIVVSLGAPDAPQTVPQSISQGALQAGYDSLIRVLTVDGNGTVTGQLDFDMTVDGADHDHIGGDLTGVGGAASAQGGIYTTQPDSYEFTAFPDGDGEGDRNTTEQFTEAQFGDGGGAPGVTITAGTWDGFAFTAGPPQGVSEPVDINGDNTVNSDDFVEGGFGLFQNTGAAGLGVEDGGGGGTVDEVEPLGDGGDEALKLTYDTDLMQATVTLSKFYADENNRFGDNGERARITLLDSDGNVVKTLLVTPQGQGGDIEYTNIDGETRWVSGDNGWADAPGLVSFVVDADGVPFSQIILSGVSTGNEGNVSDFYLHSTRVTPVEGHESTLAFSYGADGPAVYGETNDGNDHPFELTGVAVSGDEDDYLDGLTLSAAEWDGTDVVYKGMLDGTAVFELRVDSKTGAYTFLQTAPLMHEQAINDDDPTDRAVTFTFDFRITDGDGDSVDGTFRVGVTDTAPEIVGTVHAVLSEGNLPDGIPNGDEPGYPTEDVQHTQKPTTVDGYLGLRIGADNLAAFIADGPTNLTSGGDALTPIWNEATSTLSFAKGGGEGETILKITFYPEANTYSVDLLGELDHLDPELTPVEPGDGDASITDTYIDIPITFTATDGDGSQATGTLQVGIKDDVPEAKDGETSTQEGDQHPQGLVGYAQGTLDFAPGADGADATAVRIVDVLPVFFAPGIQVHDGEPESFLPTTLTSGGDCVHVKTTVAPNGDITVTGRAGGETVFTLMVQPDGSYEYKQFEPLDHPDRNETEGDDPLDLMFRYKVTDGDKDTDTATLKITVKDDGPTIHCTQDGYVNEDDLPTGNDEYQPKESLEVTGNLGIDYGADGPAEGFFPSVILTGLPQGLTSGGHPVYYVPQPGGGVMAMAAGQAVFSISIDSSGSGSYTFTLLGPLDHPDGHGQNTMDLDFGFIAKDYDRDTAEGGFTVTVRDDVPWAFASSAETTEDTRDPQSGVFATAEGDLNFGGGADGADVSNAVAIDVVPWRDGHQVVDGDDTFFGWPIPVDLEALGQQVTVDKTMSGDNILLTGTIGQAPFGLPVFVLTIEPDGHYTYNQYLPLEHPDAGEVGGADPLNLIFGYKVTDADGDSSWAPLTITVNDDGPSADDDTNDVVEGEWTFGSVTANDDGGADVLASVTKVNGVDVPTTGVATVQGQYGVLYITANGGYAYQANSNLNNAEGVTDTFTYTLTDADGDPVQATLTIDIADGEGPTVEITKKGGDDTPVNGDDDSVPDEPDAPTTDKDTPASTVLLGLQVQEADMDDSADGTDRDAGKITFNAGSDDLSVAFADPTSGIQVEGIDETLTWSKNANGHLVAKDDSGNTVLVVRLVPVGNDANDGDYKVLNNESDAFKVVAVLKDPAQHAPGDGDIEISGIQVVGTDTDGDTATAYVSVTVEDDEPVAEDDVAGCIVEDTAGALTGNVITGEEGPNNAGMNTDLVADDVGADVPGTITAFTVGANTYAFTESGLFLLDAQGNPTGNDLTGTEIQTEHGTLKMSSNGAYEYTPKDNVDQSVDDVTIGKEGTGGMADAWAGVDVTAFGFVNFDPATLPTSDGTAVTFENNGIGVQGTGHGNTQVPGQINNGTDNWTQGLIVNLGEDASAASFKVSNLYQTEDAGETGHWYAYDGEGNLVGSAAFVLSSGNVGTVEVVTDTPFQTLVFTADPYLDGTNKHNDSSDYYLRSITYTPVPAPVQESVEYTLADSDGDTSTATVTFCVKDGDGPTVTYADPQADSLDLTVEEAELDTDGSGYGDSVNENGEAESGTVTFTAGSDPIDSFTFGDTGEIEVETGLENDPLPHLVWIGTGTDTLTGYLDGEPALRLTLTEKDTGAGTVKVTATLLEAWPHEDGVDGSNGPNADDLTVTGIKVVATDIDGSTGTAIVDVTVVDDEPDISASIEDAYTTDDGDATGAVNVLVDGTIGGILSADFGADGAGDVTATVTIDGTDYAVGSDGTVAGGLGTLTWDTDAGTWSFDLSDTVAAGTEVDVTFSIVDSDGDTDADDVNHTVTFTVEDNTLPTANDDYALTTECVTEPTTNLLLCFDKSNSMLFDIDGSSYANSLAETRYAYVKTAVDQMLGQYANSGALNVAVVVFAGQASDGEQFLNGDYTSADDLVAAILEYIETTLPGNASQDPNKHATVFENTAPGNTFTDGTNYEDALTKAMAKWPGMPEDADQTYAYFVTDGVPTKGNVGDVQNSWETFLGNNSFDASYAVAAGTTTGDVSGQFNADALNKVAWPNTDSVSGDDYDDYVYVNSVVDLANVLASTVTVPAVGGNLLYDNGNAGTGDVADDFAADGAASTPIVAVWLENGASNETLDGGETLETLNGDGKYEVTLFDEADEIGTVTIDPDTGDYTFTPVDDLNVDSDLEFKIAYTIQDSNGDEDTAVLHLTITEGGNCTASGPTAIDDTNAVEDGQTGATGNVLTDDPGADHPGDDGFKTDNGQVGGNIVALVAAGAGAEADTPTLQTRDGGGPLVIAGLYGVLTLNADGSYSYEVDETKLPVFTTSDGAVSDVFTYEMSDQDGDTDTAQLTIDVGYEGVNRGISHVLYLVEDSSGETHWYKFDDYPGDYKEADHPAGYIAGVEAETGGTVIDYVIKAAGGGASGGGHFSSDGTRYEDEYGPVQNNTGTELSDTGSYTHDQDAADNWQSPNRAGHDLDGTADDDTLVGGEGPDSMFGDDGDDVFVVGDEDIIEDFAFLSGTEEDVIDLDALFDALDPGADADTFDVDVDQKSGGNANDFTVTVTADNGSDASFDVTVENGLTQQELETLIANQNGANDTPNV